MKLIAMLTDPRTIEAVTSALDEDADPLEPRPARPPPDALFQAHGDNGDDPQLDLWPSEDDNQLEWA